MKKLLFWSLYTLGLTRFAAWWHRRSVVFLCYHGVTARNYQSKEDPKGLHVERRRFTAHLECIKRLYSVIPLSEYLNARSEGRSLPHYSLVLTFDDGFRNFFTVAAPVLREHGMPASVFLITDKTPEVSLSRDRKWVAEDDRTHLSWEEVHQLEREQDVEFGSHTCSHLRLDGLSAEEVERELCDSYAVLVSHVKTPVASLSYPKGACSDVIADRARSAGYTCAVTTDRGANEIDHDLFTLGRVLIGNQDDRSSFAVRVSGLRWWLVKLVMLLGGRVKEATGGAPTLQMLVPMHESAKLINRPSK